MKAKLKVPLSAGGYVNYQDVLLKKFSGSAKIANCEKWIANLLDLPDKAVRLVLPTKRRPKKTSSLKGLRKTWQEH